MVQICNCIWMGKSGLEGKKKEKGEEKKTHTLRIHRHKHTATLKALHHSTGTEY